MYRYVGNNPVNWSDPWGLDATKQKDGSPGGNVEDGTIGGQPYPSDPGAMPAPSIPAGGGYPEFPTTNINYGNRNIGFGASPSGPAISNPGLYSGGNGPVGGGGTRSGGVSLATRRLGTKAVDLSGQAYNQNGLPYSVTAYQLNDQTYFTDPVPGTQGMLGNYTETSPPLPQGAIPLVNGHWHLPGQLPFSGLDKNLAQRIPVFKNFEPYGRRGHSNYFGERQQYNMYFRGHEYYLDHDGNFIGVPGE